MNLEELAEKKCEPCRQGDTALSSDQVAKHLKVLGNGWQLNANGHLSKEYRFKTFTAAMIFAGHAGKIADKENHHPDLHIGWGRCEVEIWTHVVDGLSPNDFYLAAKIEGLARD